MLAEAPATAEGRHRGCDREPPAPAHHRPRQQGILWRRPRRHAAFHPGAQWHHGLRAERALRQRAGRYADWRAEALLLEQRQRLAFEPPLWRPRHGGRHGSDRALGPTARRQAACGDHLLGATILNGQGELLSFGGTVMKNVASL